MLGGYFLSKKSKPMKRKKSPRRAYSPREPVVVPSRKTKEEEENLNKYMFDYMYTSQRSPPRVRVDMRDFGGGTKKSNRSKRLKKNRRPSYYGL